ncbi:MAG TPA: response regulator transcription factor [Cellvibrio sp.]
MTGIATYLLENNHLIKEGVKSILADTDFNIIDTPADMNGIQHIESNSENIELVILGVDQDLHQVEEVLEALKKIYFSGKIAILGSPADAAFITSCFTRGVHGYLTKNLSPCSLINSLHMIMAGEKIYPAEALNSLLKTSRQDKHISDSNLSARELQILKHLARGETNKQIALVQNITESTVKAHIKTILRKLGLSNRTQAARWAWGEGLTDEIADFSSYYKQTPSMMLPDWPGHKTSRVLPRQSTRQ